MTLHVRRLVPLAQGAYYALTGLWPLLSLHSFMFITGDKADTWLVQTVGVLVLAIAVPLLSAGARDRVSPEVVLLGLCSAIGFALVDVVFFLDGRIGAIYLADAAVEALLVLAWLGILALKAREARESSPTPKTTPTGRTLF